MNKISNNQSRKSHLQKIFNHPILLAFLFFAVIICYFVYNFPGIYSTQRIVSTRRTILISLDGFRFDYMDKVKTSGRKLPVLDALVKTGVKAKKAIPTFVTVTMPSHQSIVTGLYTESHGIVANIIIDPRYPNEKWSMMNQRSLNDPKFYVGLPEPIWVTCQKQGCLTGSMLWPNADAKFNGILPFKQVSQFIELNSEHNRYPYTTRLNDVINWLTDKSYHIDLVLMYFDEPDLIGHMYGPETEQVYDKIVELDQLLGQFINLLKKHNLYDNVDIILTSDHGMAEVSSKRQIALNEYVDSSLYTYSVLRPFSSIVPEKGHEQTVYDKLKNAHPNYTVYWKKDVPDRLHYKMNEKIGSIVGISDEGWHVVQQRLTNTWVGGTHGYDNQLANMHSIFIANGPSFKKNFVLPELNLVDIYPLICHLTNIQPNPHNGSFERIRHILEPLTAGSDKPQISKNYKFLPIVIFITLICAILYVRCRK